jgi:hypothetical protein
VGYYVDVQKLVERGVRVPKKSSGLQAKHSSSAPKLKAPRSDKKRR